MRFQIGRLILQWKGRELDAVEARLRRISQAREHWGCLYQDSNGGYEGEVFVGQMTQAQFNELPLKTRRIAGLAHSFRGKRYKHNGALAFDVYAQSGELHSLGIQFKF